MPWREKSPVDLRVQFISEYLADRFTMTALAAQYGISRKTAYKWVARYDAAGPAALGDRSRRPHQHPAATAPALVEALLRVRRRHPQWGPRSCWRWGAGSSPTPRGRVDRPCVICCSATG